MDTLLLAMLVKLGGGIGAWKQAGEPTDEEIRALLITCKPVDLPKK